jgi:hypothetical protein
VIPSALYIFYTQTWFCEINQYLFKVESCQFQVLDAYKSIKCFRYDITNIGCQKTNQHVFVIFDIST